MTQGKEKVAKRPDKYDIRRKIWVGVKINITSEGKIYTNGKGNNLMENIKIIMIKCARNVKKQ